MERRIRDEWTDRLPLTVVRPPSVYGPRDVDFLKLFRMVARGRAPHLTGPAQEVSVIHVRDLTEAMRVFEELATREVAPSDAVSALPPVHGAGEAGPAVASGVSGVLTPDGVVLHRHQTDAIALLDPLAGTIWSLLDGSASVEDLVADLAAAFDHPQDAVRHDLARLLEQLADHGFLAG